MNGGFYEDDLFLQQLYELQQYELQQIDENEPEPQNYCESDFDFESEPLVNPSTNYFKPMSEKCFESSATPLAESNGAKKLQKNDQEFLKLIGQQNLKKRKLIKILSNECLELFIESLGESIHYSIVCKSMLECTVLLMLEL